MLPSQLVLYSQMGFAALLLVLLILRPEIFRSLEGKVLGLAALFLVPAIALYGGYSAHVEHSATTGYCLSCHVMTDYGKSLQTQDAASLPASHFQNHLVPAERACVSCHMNYGLSGDLHEGARHEIRLRDLLRHGPGENPHGEPLQEPRLPSMPSRRALVRGRRGPPKPGSFSGGDQSRKDVVHEERMSRAGPSHARHG